MILKPCKKITFIPHHVNNYSKVIEFWNKYKKNRRISIDIILKNIFDFHLSKNNHVLLYYSTNLDNCLMMCKINEKYINIRAPIQDKFREQFSQKPCFIATYC